MVNETGGFKLCVLCLFVAVKVAIFLHASFNFSSIILTYNNSPKCFIFNHANLIPTQTCEIQPFEVSKQKNNDKVKYY